MKYFDSFIEFVVTVQRYQKYLKGCSGCGFVWFTKKDIVRLNEEQVEEIQRCVADCNSLDLKVHKLAELKIEISHGICTPCWRLKRGEKVRREQQEMGYNPCYGTADHGHCTQAACKWFSVCVVDQEVLAIWKQRADVMNMTASIH